MLRCIEDRPGGWNIEDRPGGWNIEAGVPWNVQVGVPVWGVED